MKRDNRCICLIFECKENSKISKRCEEPVYKNSQMCKLHEIYFEDILTEDSENEK